jgi:hypothetical protein
MSDIAATRIFVAIAVALPLACTPRLPAAAAQQVDGGRASAVKAPAPAQAICDVSGPALPAASLTVEWQHEETVQRLVVAADGTIRARGAIVARLLGACVLDARGEVLRAIDARDVVSDAHRQRVGSFQRRAHLREESGETLRVHEVLASSDSTMTAVTDDGAVYLARPGQAAFSLPANVEGDVARARRAALLLLDLGPELVGPAD